MRLAASWDKNYLASLDEVGKVSIYQFKRGEFVTPAEREGQNALPSNGDNVIPVLCFSAVRASCSVLILSDLK